ncbi:MAG: type II secretion system F family protein [Chloroflexi bacterium]|nr:type II secretion system F family protein [Chloroflexota bacterium]
MMALDQSALVLGLVFLLVAQAVLVATSTSYGERESAANRLAVYTAPSFQGSLPTAISVLRQRRYSRFPLLDAVLVRFDVADGLSIQLQQAGLPLRASEFLFVQLVAATLVALLAAVAAWQTFGGLMAATGGLAIGFVAPLIYLRYRKGTRKTAFEQGLPDTLDRVTGALRAGYGLEYGFDLVARESTGPCAEEFGQILQELNLGADLEEALARLIQRVPSEDARLLATAVAVQRRTGGNLVEVLGQMAQMLRERERLRREVRVITTAPRVSGYVVAGLPLVTAAVMLITSPYYINTLLSEPLGRIAAGVGGFLVVLGLLLNRRIAQVDM